MYGSIPVTSVTWITVVWGSQNFEARLGNLARPYLKVR